MNIIKLILLLIFSFPAISHAYLDPGTGNALVAAFFGLVGSVLFFSKNLYYKIKSKITGKEIIKTQENKIAFFSEGARYFPFYKDILIELIKAKVKFIYYTQDLDDPAFNLLPFGDPQADLDAFGVQYIGSGNKGYAFISSLKEPILITTTPNISVKNYPISKSKYCKNLVHIFHALGSVGGYKKYSLDFFDTVILPGKEFAKDIRELESKRNLAQKTLLIGGLPYLDNLIERAKTLDAKTDGKTILIASTWD
ncbi:MAG: hypothetical protein LBC07_02865 [Elusimicrobiota bacterium]|jgi:hypothetical protein|nr:hypothetical protein [Elusimicrobiota bacterium]